MQYLLELLHVEELHGPLHLEGAVRHLEDVVGDGAALVVERVLEKLTNSEKSKQTAESKQTKLTLT